MPEHHVIAEYVREVGGRGYFEVPIAGASHSAGSSPRYLDAVRIEDVGAGDMVEPFDPDRFEKDLRNAAADGRPIELIEAKRKLNRPVIGQIIAGGDLFLDAYPAVGPVRLSIVVGEDRDDPALRQVCTRRGIRVHLRPWITSRDLAAKEDQPT